MENQLDIVVIWSTKKVDVHVVVEADLAGDDESTAKTRDGKPTRLLSHRALKSRLTLGEFLEETTHPEPDGARVEALCFLVNLSRLLDILELEEVPSIPVEFELGHG